MDELIEELDAMDWGEHPAVGKAAIALRAFAEREKELVEALESYSCYCATGYCEVGTHDDTICGNRARATLSKHKEQS